MEPDTLLRIPVPPLPNKEQGRLVGSARSLAPLHFPSELLPFDEALRDICTIRPLMEGDAVARHGGQLLDIKAAERRGSCAVYKNPFELYQLGSNWGETGIKIIVAGTMLKVRKTILVFLKPNSCLALRTT